MGQKVMAVLYIGLIVVWAFQAFVADHSLAADGGWFWFWLVVRCAILGLVSAAMWRGRKAFW